MYVCVADNRTELIVWTRAEAFMVQLLLRVLYQQERGGTKHAITYTKHLIIVNRRPRGTVRSKGIVGGNVRYYPA
jgi:hypothetical protein